MTVVLGWLLGAVFGIAGIAKLARPRAFHGTLVRLVGRRAAGPPARVLPVAECLLALWLLSGLAPRPAAALALLLLAAMSAFLWRLARRGQELGCACFGELAAATPGRALARNAALGGAAVAVLVAPEARPGSLGQALGLASVTAGIACVWMLAGALAGRVEWLRRTEAVR